MGNHPVVRLVEIAVAGLALMTGAQAQDGADPSRRFFRAGYVDFWGNGQKSKGAESRGNEDLFTDAIVTDDGRVQSYRPPQVVVDLLASPSEENARKYLAWQWERLRRIAAAVKAVRDATGKVGQDRLSVRAAYFKRAGCPACARQDVEIKKLSARVAAVTEIDEPAVLEASGIEAVPTLVISDSASGRRKVLAGFHDAQAILSAARELAGGKDEAR